MPQVQTTTATIAALPAIFTQSPSEVVAAQRAEIVRQEQDEDLPFFLRWWKLEVQEWFSSVNGAVGVTILVQFVQIGCWIWLCARLPMLIDRLGPPVLLFLLFLLSCIVALGLPTDDGKRSFHYPEYWLLWLLWQVPGSMLVCALMNPFVQRRIKARQAFRIPGHIVQQRQAMDDGTLAKALYLEELERLRAGMLGETSQVSVALKAARDQLTNAKAHLLQLEHRRQAADASKEKTRISTLDAAIKAQRDRIATLTTVVEDLEQRVQAATAFLNECELIASELAEMAGDAALLQQIEQAAGLDQAIIDQARAAGDDLRERLATAFKGLNASLASAEIDQIERSLSAGSIDHILEA